MAYLPGTAIDTVPILPRARKFIFEGRARIQQRRLRAGAQSSAVSTLRE